VRNHGRQHFLDIVRRHELRSTQRCGDPRSAQQCQGTARRKSQAHLLLLARRLRQIQHIGDELRRDVHRVDASPGGIEHLLRDRTRGRDRVGLVQPTVLAENRCLIGARWISHVDAQHEPVELRLGQRIGPFEIMRILRGDDQECGRQRVTAAIYRYLPLLHRLEQRRLGLRTRAVDLVDQQHIREQRAWAKHEGALGRVEQVSADDIGGHEIGSALNAIISAPQSCGERLAEQRFAETRRTLHQHMAARDDRDRDQTHDGVQANHRGTEDRPQPLRKRR
jgi:uncharacterized protein YukE